ncbi:MAG: hypothetical protein FJX76_08325 [Armatimonadetes bacterium]|nr:hypothetical protein [Armatimonadota bacterium]
MTQPVGSGQPREFDFQRLQKIVSLVEGQSSPFKAVDRSTLGETGDHDVIVMKPMPIGDLARSNGVVTNEIQKDLEGRGIDVEAPLETVGGVAARVNPEEMTKLKSEGYLVYDNSRRSLIPGFPGKSFNGDPTKMPEVNFRALTGADQMNAQGFTGKGQVVAVVDSGFQHPATPLVAFKDFVDNSPTPVDPVGHGTHVAGDILQVAPDAQIVGVRVMNGDGQGRPSDIIRGLQWVLQNYQKYNISTVNMSLGGGPDGFPDTMDPVNRAVDKLIQRGVTVVSAAGNSGPEGHTIGAPADGALNITVGASFDKTRVSEFSSRGPTDDGLSKPDLMAPGEFIVSWSVPGSQMHQMGTVIEKLRNMKDDEFVALCENKPELIENLGLPRDILQRSPQERMDILHKTLPPIFLPSADTLAAPGTSFAAPIVAGIVADLKQADPTAGPQRIKEVLRKTADPMDSRFGPNDQGAGFVDGVEALDTVRGK